MKTTLLTLSCIFLGFNAVKAQELLSNGSFETGDITGWTVSSIGGVDGLPNFCVENWRVESSSASICGMYVPEINPTDGTSAVFSSFDSDVPNTEWRLEQTVTLPASLGAAEVSFDFALNVDFALVANATMPRELNVAFYTTGGTFIADLFNDNSFFSMDTLLVAYSQNIDVSGMLSGLDGTDVVLRFTAVIPEVSTGPGKAMIDNVSFYHSSVGLDNENMDLIGLNILPNPAINELSVTATGEIGHLTIYDLTGKIVAEYLLKENESIIDVSDLASGSYLLRTDNNGVMGTQKFIKK